MGLELKKIIFMKVPVSVVVLTFNEEKNIRECLESLVGFTDHIYVVDSGSTDKTLAILEEFNVKVVYNPFENYSQQRNWAINNLNLATEWIINIDADHRLTQSFKEYVVELFKNGISEDVGGFMASRKTIFMGKWIRYGGHYPTYHSIMFRNGKGKCEEKLYDQHFVVQGKILKIKGDIIDLITDSLSTFTLRHNKWSTLEAEQQLNNSSFREDVVIGDLSGNPIEKRRFIKNIYEKFPLFVRPVVYFLVRYFFRFGFLDGRRGLIFHFLQCFWFRFLIDAKIYELKKNKNAKIEEKVKKGLEVN